MTNALTRLIALLTLKPLGNGIFQGESQDLGLPQVFGGQAMAQALAAAMNVVGEERFLHSCHAYFLRAGSAKEAIIYETEVLREGNSFTVVEVSAKQQGELIFRLNSSFHVEEPGFEHQAELGDTAEPTQWVDENQLIQQLAATLPEPLRTVFSQERAFDVKAAYLNNPFKGQVLPPVQRLWAKTNGEAPNNRRLQQCLLAYFSDFHCVPTMLHPHACGIFEQKVRFATLDHSIWFHRPFDFNQGLRFELVSTNASGARGLTGGRVYRQDGALVASYQQEGLIRPIA